MSKKEDDIGREIKQLWCIANYYFCKAKSLKANLQPKFLQEKIRKIADNQIYTTIEMQPTDEMKFSAHLGSRSIRLSTIEELLHAYGKESKQNKIYNALRQLSDVSQDTLEKNTHDMNIFHFLFRNIIAHKEPQGEGRKVYQEMEKFFKTRTHDEIYFYTHKSLEEIKNDIKKHYCKVKP